MKVIIKAAVRGFHDLRCPMCGQDDSISVNLQDVTVFTCLECREEFGPDLVRGLIDAWQDILNWVSLAPKIEE